MERMVWCAGLCSSTLRVTVTLSDQAFAASLLSIPLVRKPWFHCCTSLDFGRQKSSLITSLTVQIPELPCAAGSAFSYTHISPLAQAAVPNCSGSQPTLSPFWFQVLMTVTSYFQPECFPTHGTANVQADLRSSFFPTVFGFSLLQKVMMSSFKN